MIRSLRQRHRHAFIALGVFVPIAFAIGIAARKPAPVVRELPAALTAASPSYEPVGKQRSDLFSKVPVQTQILREEKDSTRFAVQLVADKNFLKPDMIVYWIAGSPAISNAVPDAAILVGELGPSALPLPDQASNTSGVLLLYSLADGEIVDVSKPFSLPSPNTPTH